MQEHDEVLGRGIPVLDLALVAVTVHGQPRLVEPARPVHNATQAGSSGAVFGWRDS